MERVEIMFRVARLIDRNEVMRLFNLIKDCLDPKKLKLEGYSIEWKLCRVWFKKKG